MLVNENSKISHPIIIFILIGLFISSFVQICTEIPRSDFSSLSIWYCIAFASYILLAFKTSIKYLNWLLAAAVLIRFSLVIGLSWLSDDFFRFLWDGHLFANGINPFNYKPSQYIELAADSSYLSSLYPKLNSPDYISVYPAFLQYLFGLSSVLFPDPLSPIMAKFSPASTLKSIAFKTIVLEYPKVIFFT